MTDYKALVKQARMGAADGDLVTASDYADVTERLADAVEELVAENEKLRERLAWTELQEGGLRDDIGNLVAERDALLAQLDDIPRRIRNNCTIPSELASPTSDAIVAAVADWIDIASHRVEVTD